MNTFYFIFDFPKAYISSEKEDGILVGTVSWRGRETLINIISKVDFVKSANPKRRPDKSIYALLKSNLQKQIRRFQPATVSTAEYMWRLDPFELLRRIPIIACEDSQLFEEISVIVWLMAAYTKGFPVEDYKEWVMGIVQKISRNRKCPWLEGGGFSRKTSNPELFLEDVLESDHPQKGVLSGILFRCAYGGLKQDPHMLSMMISDIIRDNYNIPSFDIIPIKNYPKGKIHPASMDNHNYPGILTKLSVKHEITENEIATVIWRCSSCFNYRCMKKPTPEQEKIWNLIKNDFEELGYQRLTQIYTYNRDFAKFLG